MHDSREDMVRYAESRRRQPKASGPQSAFTSGFNGCLGVGCAVICVVIGIPLALFILGSIFCR